MTVDWKMGALHVVALAVVGVLLWKGVIPTDAGVPAVTALLGLVVPSTVLRPAGAP